MSSSQTTLQTPPQMPATPSAAPVPRGLSPETCVRLVVSAALVACYYLGRGQAASWLQRAWEAWMGTPLRPSTAATWLVASLIACLFGLWWRVLARNRQFHAPILVTAILLLGDAGFGILENHYSPLLDRLTGGTITRYSPTFMAIVTTVLTELILGRFFYGKWPHPASAYVSGISAGILIKSPYLWPFVLCGMISITSKYVLRFGDRHLWNPTNLGVTLMLLLAPQYVASLSVQAGNEVWAVVVIWILGGMILGQLRLLHITVAFLLTFVPLSLFRAWWTGNPVMAEIAPMTSPMFQLFIFFMITDPKTITRPRWSQVLVAVLVAVAETFYRLVFRDVHSLYHSLFTVGPIANLIEIAYHRHQAQQRVEKEPLAVAR